jgi:tetratricopeptide (TPR) repeat protein
MNLPVSVERTDPPAATADGFLLPDAAAERLGECVAALSGDGPPGVYRVRGGWLLVQPAASAVSPPGLLRLKRVAAQLFLPIDAALSPALLPDEFPGLTRGGGLVMLPTAALAFDPTSPVPASSWLALPPQRDGKWAAYPPPPPGADTLRVIERPAPPAAIVEILQAGEPDGHSPLPGDLSGDPSALPDDARPPAGTFLRQLGAGAVLGVAGALAWLGRQLGAGRLARAGADLARRAIEQVPRLSERVIGAQEAALRELLRQLRTGDVEKALRRAPVAVADPNQRGSVSGGASLGDRDTRFSLTELIRGGSGASSIWVGGGDVWGLLQAEYRRLAEEAMKRGDYRRAAYLWGVLLRDLRSAANVLTAGGLYRDAALLLRDKLNDPTGAAAAFELAGDFDEAVRLYDKAGEDLKAAELLRRIGDEERAKAFFLAAADKMANRHEYLQAGDLIRAKLGRIDLAIAQYRMGWRDDRPGSVTCGERLFDHFCSREDQTDCDRLMDEAVARFVPPNAADAGKFFNYALGVGSEYLPEDRLQNLRDRVRLLFADHLRTGGRAKSRVDALFGDWPAAVRRDAAFAAHVSAPPVAVPKPKPVADGTVRAVVFAPGGGRLFIGTDDTITAWDVRNGVSGVVAHTWKGELLALCADDDGRRVYGLLDQTAHLRLIALRVPAYPGRGQALASADIPCQNPKTAYLQPRCFADPFDDAVVVHADGGRLGYHGHTLTTVSTRWFRNTGTATHWIGQTRDVFWAWDDGVLAGWRRHHRGDSDYFVSVWKGSLGWVPAAGVGIQPAVDWFAPDDTTLVLAGIDADGVLHRSEITYGGAERVEPSHQNATHPDGFAAVTVLRGGRLAAITRRNQLRVLRQSGVMLVSYEPDVELDCPDPVVYLTGCDPAGDLVAVSARGSVLRVP